MRNEDVMVSICCTVYNQEKYIKKAIDSFLQQDVNFKYEIIIHDDASNDSTPDIIKEYQKKYPEIIKPIYQKENQYSKGKKVSLIAMENAKGKYIALCEGDDYWIDSSKLERQVNYMEKHPKCSLCFHNAYTYNLLTQSKVPMMKKTRRYYKFLKNYNVGDMAKLDFIPTASLMFKKSDVKRLPDFYKSSIVGDLPLRLIMTSFGYCHYIDRIMSMYVRGTGKSATDEFKKNLKDIDKTMEYLAKKQECIKNVNKYTNYKFNKDFQIALNRIESDKYMYKEQYVELFKNKEVLKASPRKRILWILKNELKRYINERSGKDGNNKK